MKIKQKIQVIIYKLNKNLNILTNVLLDIQVIYEKMVYHPGYLESSGSIGRSPLINN